MPDSDDMSLKFNIKQQEQKRVTLLVFEAGCFFVVEMATGRILSAPGDGGWKSVLNKSYLANFF